jgi:hypothetical protein
MVRTYKAHTRTYPHVVPNYNAVPSLDIATGVEPRSGSVADLNLSGIKDPRRKMDWPRYRTVNPQNLLGYERNIEDMEGIYPPASWIEKIGEDRNNL